MVTISRQRSDRVAPSSFGNRTPNSERGELIPSCPYFVHSFTAGILPGKQRYHRNSPSVSSARSLQFTFITSYHRRAGCGFSARVVRLPSQVAVRAVHPRSNSATSSTPFITLFEASRVQTYKSLYCLLMVPTEYFVPLSLVSSTCEFDPEPKYPSSRISESHVSLTDLT